jgi:dTDP-4-dehydrorhamnose 3,5-epimerase
MHLRASPLAGAFIVEVEPHVDARGLFARTWCAREFQSSGLMGEMVQASISSNVKRGTVRGMHLQLPPSREAKLVRVSRGAIFDVIIDLRPDSATYLQHFGIVLSASEHNSLYIPPEFAHGFQTIEDDTQVEYHMTDVYAPELGYGIRWDDPAFAINWPIRPAAAILPRDASFPNFDRVHYEAASRARPRPHRAGTDVEAEERKL